MSDNSTQSLHKYTLPAKLEMMNGSWNFNLIALKFGTINEVLLFVENFRYPTI